MREDSFLKRYITKIISSVFIVLLNAVSQMILPRALGVEQYGYLSYNMNIFTSITLIGNLSMSNAFISKIAKKQEDGSMILFYAKFFMVMTFILNIGIFMAASCNSTKGIFEGQELLIVLLALNATIANKLLSDIVALYDTYALTSYPAWLSVIQKVVFCAIIIILYAVGFINIVIYYALQFGLVFILCVGLTFLFYKEKSSIIKITKSDKKYFYMQEFFVFCKPLVISTVISSFMSILSNRFLMGYAGASEQAFFGVAVQLNILIGYIFSPYAELLKREFSINIYSPEELLRRYKQASRIMFLMTGYFSLYIAINADWVLTVIFGQEYLPALAATKVMMLYTLYQAWGQINGSLLMATERTKVSLYLNIIHQLISFIFIFIFQIPNSLWPEGLGAMGICMNYFLGNFVVCILFIACNSKYLHIRFWDIYGMQFPIIACCIISGMSSRKIVQSAEILWKGKVSALLCLLISGVVYTFFMLVFVFKLPCLTGLKNKDIKYILNQFSVKRRV